MFINFIITCIELTEEEKVKINKKLIDEIEID